MRNRLIELINNYPCMSTAEDCFIESISSDLADYLLSNGVIVPPCKIGDTVYQPSYKFTKCSIYDYAPRYCEDSFCCGCESACDSVQQPYIYEGKVVSVRITKEQIYLSVSFQEKFDSSSFILGKTVFLTREEAERALKGGEQ